MHTRTTSNGRERGVIATEYVILLVLTALAIVGGAAYLGSVLNANVSEAADTVSSSIP